LLRDLVRIVRNNLALPVFLARIVDLPLVGVPTSVLLGPYVPRGVIGFSKTVFTVSNEVFGRFPGVSISRLFALRQLLFIHVFK
jgi:hypothetical protein